MSGSRRRGPPSPPPPEPEADDRVTTPARTEEDAAEATLRPRSWPISPASRRSGKTSPSSSRPPAPAARRWTTCCCTARPASARPPWRRSWRASWASASAPPAGRSCSGPATWRRSSTNLQPRDVLFVDEIHRLQPALEETLYPAMEDFQLDLIIGEGPAARTVRIDLPPFTLVGATTRAGLLATPLRDRFGIPLRLQFYTPEELLRIVRRGAQKLELRTGRGRRAGNRPTLPRHAARRGAAAAAGAGLRPGGRHRAPTAPWWMARWPGWRWTRMGLDAMDRRYLRRIAEHHNGGPVGVETLAAALAESRDTIEDVIEPYLIQEGLVHAHPARPDAGRARLAPPRHDAADRLRRFSRTCCCREDCRR